MGGFPFNGCVYDEFCQKRFPQNQTRISRPLPPVSSQKGLSPALRGTFPCVFWCVRKKNSLAKLPERPVQPEGPERLGRPKQPIQTLEFSQVEQGAELELGEAWIQLISVVEMKIRPKLLSLRTRYFQTSVWFLFQAEQKV